MRRVGLEQVSVTLQVKYINSNICNCLVFSSSGWFLYKQLDGVKYAMVTLSANCNRIAIFKRWLFTNNFWQICVWKSPEVGLNEGYSIASPTHNAAPNPTSACVMWRGRGGGFSLCAYTRSRGGGEGWISRETVGATHIPTFCQFPQLVFFPFFVSKILPFLLF